MKEPRTLALHNLGQRLWLDNITRQLLQSGTLARYIRDCSVTGLTSNPTIFDASQGTDGWVSLEVSPLLAHDAAGTIRAAARLHARPRAPRRNEP
jgi:transaldolase